MTSHREFSAGDLEKKATQPLQIENSILIDARSPLEYNLAHVPGSYNMQWEDFSQSWTATPGLLKPELDKLCDRLALFGIEPNSHVIVIGYGTKGAGEEGRLAWTLFYLGVNDVQFVSIQHFGTQLTQQESPPAKNAAYWKPRLRANALVAKSDLIDQLFPKKGQRAPNVRVIDVRTPTEYLKGGSALDLGAFNIDWREFLTAEGRPNLRLGRKLEASGIHKEDQIYVVSNRGVRSAAATMALRMMGFRQAANYAGGYSELALHPGRP